MEIAAGYYHSLILDGATVFGCGQSSHGQLGLNNASMAKLEKIGNLPNIVSVAAGGYHSLFLDTKNCVWVCGLNDQGQIGLGSTNKTHTITKIDKIPPIA